MEQVDHGRSPIVTADTRYSGSSSSLTPAMCTESSRVCLSLLSVEWSTRSLCKLSLLRPQLPVHISQRPGFHPTAANQTAYDR